MKKHWTRKKSQHEWATKVQNCTTNESFKDYLPIKGSITTEYQKKIIEMQKAHNEKRNK